MATEPRKLWSAPGTPKEGGSGNPETLPTEAPVSPPTPGQAPGRLGQVHRMCSAGKPAPRRLCPRAGGFARARPAEGGAGNQGVARAPGLDLSRLRNKLAVEQGLPPQIPPPSPRMLRTGLCFAAGPPTSPPSPSPSVVQINTGCHRGSCLLGAPFSPETPVVPHGPLRASWIVQLP